MGQSFVFAKAQDLQIFSSIGAGGCDKKNIKRPNQLPMNFRRLEELIDNDFNGQLSS